jgi:predicted glycogen debranching enzyme
MSNDIQIILDPVPGSSVLRHRGDTLVFSLKTKQPMRGQAFLRTNLGRGHIIRQQIRDAVENNVPPSGRDWFDIPFVEVESHYFRLCLPLVEVGHFEAKALFIPEGQKQPIWVPGANIGINVEPANTCCANIIYNAFVRQFGANKSGQGFGVNHLQAMELLDETGYHVIPPSGTFRDLIQELDFIIDTLGCRYIQLLPIHPTPTTFGRMGRFGSPYAALSFTAVDPALAEFDSSATPLEQFLELVQAVHAHNAKVLLDIAINHTGWAASLHETHPQWLARSDQGNIEVPGAWGVRWEDLTKLNYQHRDLWHYMAEVFLTWCRRGVDGFRCDAGYMIPAAVWQYIIAVVRDQFPDTIFFLEGLGGKVTVTRDLLDTANFNWAYSELFQNYSRQDILAQMDLTQQVSQGQGLMVHYAETHDNLRLASRSQTWARMRTALCALTSFHGGFGFANGVEWFADQKINVHEAPSLNWGSDQNQVDPIQRLSRILKNHPAFWDQSQITVIDQESEQILIFLRQHLATEKKLLVIVNLDDSRPHRAVWPKLDHFKPITFWQDLLSGERVASSTQAETNQIDLLPGQVLCISDEPDIYTGITADTGKPSGIPDRIIRQQLRLKALEVHQAYHHFGDMGDWDLDAACTQLAADPLDFCRQMNPHSDESRTIQWFWPQDSRRVVMLLPQHFLFLQSPHPFSVKISHGQKIWASETSLASQQNTHWALIKPLPPSRNFRHVNMSLSIYEHEKYHQVDARLLLLPKFSPEFSLAYSRHSINASQQRMLLTNQRGAACMLPLAWDRQYSRYDSLLAANNHPDLPVDRWIMFTRLRAWVVYQDYSQALDMDCLRSFNLNQKLQGQWTFHVSTGCGTHVILKLWVKLHQDLNRIQLAIHRIAEDGEQGRLSDSESIQIIMRPDIENRSFHANTKAYQEVENAWPQALACQKDGFTFKPDDLHGLKMEQPGGEFVLEPEWHYMIHRSEDADRGFDPHGDLFSPGYFKMQIQGGEQAGLRAWVDAYDENSSPDLDANATPHQSTVPKLEEPGTASVKQILMAALNQYVVRRGEHQTVIAGFPWFLDWGRDAIIVTRALIAMGEFAVARQVLGLFGGYEENGSLPNMLHGRQTSNRDTSDAPLWFIVACRDLLEKEGDHTWLAQTYAQRSIKEIILSIANAYMRGTKNGIHMDSASGLIFSPSHYTWMDTNHPAGTPREGYAIEIQALWYAALQLLAHIDAKEGCWAQLAAQVQTSIEKLFWLPSEGYLADCLCTGAGSSARDARPDDALRPNQLLAVTLDAFKRPSRCQALLQSCQALLIPGAIRSLADRPLKRPLEIVHHGQPLGDPHAPYRGRYEGDEDTQRKPAYHNGTAWTWPFPSFCEAWAKVFGSPATQTAMAWLNSIAVLMQDGCVGHLPEILDGDMPHQQRGCPAQAWGASEALRVWLKLEQDLADHNY